MDLSINVQENPAVLVLKDGTVFYGKAAGKIGTTTGEICFNTGMTGYQEVFTDPSYYNQIIVMTSVHIGNYGTKNNEIESSKMKIAGMVCRDFNRNPSRDQSDFSIQEYFESEEKVAICDIDTRAVVRHVRDQGAMNAIISSDNFDIEDLKRQLNEVPSMDGLELASKVCTKETYYVGDPNANFKVSVLDLGVKNNILKCLTDKDCYLKVYPSDSNFEMLNDWNPDGFFISNGPGDPSVMPSAIQTVKDILIADRPMFGICLGHQMISIANGLSTFKMHNGHRGLNHPIKNLLTGTAEVTSQNHGFCVSMEDAKKNENVEVSHINLNDDTLAGIRLKNKKAFSVQYHPEASPGPHDSRYLFDDFVNLMKGQPTFKTSRVDLQLA